eukprot:CAMPEP_0184657236 /NCGR_PEP_ID=MMETSP0308-20130426/17989_1 /TAXON_ID=38269 /ORGANISM="Gloeochaete witrockiana, Strain SAG 46.84" /LENGTH=176 /DNA_ID=CAMNT_0027094825 /DNA_START=392 /DNA_END=922 /DNA_ORIENTATION=-
MEPYPPICEHLSDRYFHEKPLVEYNSLPHDLLKQNFIQLLTPEKITLPEFPESHEQMMQRAHDAVHKVANRICLGRKENVMLVSHGAVCQSMIRALVGEEEFRKKVPGAVGYCASAKLIYVDGIWKIEWYHAGEKTRNVLHWYSFLQDRVMELFVGPLKQRLKQEMSAELRQMAHQ